MVVGEDIDGAGAGQARRQAVRLGQPEQAERVAVGDKFLVPAYLQPGAGLSAEAAHGRIGPESDDGIGVAHHARQVLAGESWSEGQVILSWYDTLAGAAVPDDGQNVVIHEFAHQLDQETGHANGAPRLRQRAHYKRWSRVLGAEFNALQARTVQDETSLFSSYGATDPAEFFAVISEVFFEQPQRMASEHPALYHELTEFYRLDPLTW